MISRNRVCFLLALPLLALATGCQTKLLELEGEMSTLDQSLKNHRMFAVMVDDPDALLRRYQSAKVEIRERVKGQLLDKGYDVVERDKMAVALREHRFGVSEMSDRERSECAKAAGADAMFIVEVTSAKVTTPKKRHEINSVFHVIPYSIRNFFLIGWNLREAKVSFNARIVEFDSCRVKLSSWSKARASVYENDELGAAHTAAAERLTEEIPERRTAATVRAVTGAESAE